MSCGDKCKCDCCKAKKKAAAAAKRRNKAKSSKSSAAAPVAKQQAPLIMIHTPKSNELPTLNVSNHPSTMPKNKPAATQTTTPSRVTMATQTDALTRPLPELPRLRENVTRPPQRRTATQQDETLPHYGFTTRTGTCRG